MSRAPATPATRSARSRRIVAAALALFGALTVFAAGSVLAGFDGGRAGATVGFVLRANLLLGLAYLLAAALLWRASPWARPAAFAIAAATALVALGFALVALGGTPVEPRTAAALALRAGVWAAVGWWAGREPRQ